MAMGAVSLAVSLANMPSVDRTNCPCAAISTSGAIMSTGVALVRSEMTTGALSGCGACEWDVGDYLKVFAAQR